MNWKIDPEGAFGFLLHDVARLMRRNFNRRIQALGLTQAQCRALLHLARNEGIQQVALAEILEVTPITLARLLDKLETAGVIERRRDPGDRRAFQLYLTEKAKPLMADIWQHGTDTRTVAAAGIDPAALQHFIRTLQDIKDNLLNDEHSNNANGIAPAADAENDA